MTYFDGNCRNCGRHGQMGEERKQVPNEKFWFCVNKGHNIFTCKKFLEMRDEGRTDNVMCKEDDSANKLIDEIAFSSMEPEGCIMRYNSS